MTIQEQIDLIRNETAAGGNSRGRVADAMEALNQNLQRKPILLSNTYWINLDLTENDIVNRIFRSWLDAKDWIIANTTYSESNLHQINLPAGNVGDVTLEEGIRLSVTDATVIETLRSNVTFDGGLNTVLKAYLSGAIINNLDLVGDGKCCALYNCVVNNVIAATSQVIYVANDTTFLAGNFDNYTGFQFKCNFNAVRGNITNLNLNATFTEINTGGSDHFELSCLDVFCTFSKLDNFTVFGRFKIKNCTSEIVSLCNESGISNSFMSNITATGTATVVVRNSDVGDILLEDTATFVHENCTIGATTVAAGATLTRISEPFDNTSSGLTATSVQDAIAELKALIDAMS